MIDLTNSIGYAAMACLLVSFLMKNVRTLRIVNSFGCAIFIVYGILLPSIPILITNAAIVLINLYYLLLKRPQDTP